MLKPRTVAAVLAAVLLIVAPGCSRSITGTALPDPNKPPVAVADDGYGIKVGFKDAPVQLELYTEPQCSHCADLQHDFGEQFGHYIAIGELAITYRPMTFLDTGANLHSARVANAMFAAVTKSDDSTEPVTTDGLAFQRFVEAAWAEHGSGPDHPSASELSQLAGTAGIPDAQTGRIGLGKPAVDLQELEDTNFEFMYEIDPVQTGTPTVYDLKSDQKLDIYDDNWLSKLMES